MIINVVSYVLVWARKAAEAVEQDNFVRKLFEGKNFVFVSTIMEDGTPHTTPTWVDLDDGNILVNTAIGRVKYENVSRDPRISIAIIDQTNPYDMVTARGRVIQQITGDEADRHIDKLAKKYLGKDKYPGRAPGEKRVILKIKPERLTHMKQ
jgi:PPOX class probable F420-dependent enzyme